MKQTIIGLVGTIGSGKDTVAHFLVEQCGFAHRFDSDILADELRARGVPVIRENLRDLANEIRANGKSILMSDELFRKILSESDKVAVGSFRTPLEIDQLKAEFPHAIIIGVDAPVEMRYERAVVRNHEKDQISFERFVELEQIEMHSTDPNKQNVRQALEKADYQIVNDSTLESLYMKIQEILAKIAQ